MIFQSDEITTEGAPECQNLCVSYLLSHKLKFQISYRSELLLWRYFSDTRYFKVPIRQGDTCTFQLEKKEMFVNNTFIEQ